MSREVWRYVRGSLGRSGSEFVRFDRQRPDVFLARPIMLFEVDTLSRNDAPSDALLVKAIKTSTISRRHSWARPRRFSNVT